jgi:hypothetical protein
MIGLAIRKNDGTLDIMYEPQPYQLPYHTSTLPNLLLTGPRGTGKSLSIRMDSHMRAMMVPDFKYLTVRRTMPELKKSHLIFINNEMDRLGGYFHSTDYVAKYPNGSLGFYGHCETEADIERYLSSQFDLVNFDEATTFHEEMFLKIAACARVPTDSGRIAMVRGGTNPLGVGAEFIKKYFIDKNVTVEENEDYVASDYGVIETKLDDNKKIDTKQYRKRLSILPEHVRRAWLDGEWVVEGAYFADFHPTKDVDGAILPWHCIDDLPTMRDPRGDEHSILDYSWINIYRCIDWGFDPDPAVCLWIAVLPNKQAVVFKECTWHRTLASDVAAQIKRESEGMHIVETFCDPTMFYRTGNEYSIGDLFENEGVPLTATMNKRDLFGYSIHHYLNTVIDGRPMIQIVKPMGLYGCPQLIKTLPNMRMDKTDKSKLAEGNDHWVVCLAYFCMGQAPASQNPEHPDVPRWMRPKSKNRHLMV